MRKRLIILSLILLATIASAIFIPRVNVNYDLTQYLPKDSNTQEGLTILEDEFGIHSLIELQINDISPQETIVISQSINQINHIEEVIWLDDYVDLTTTPIEYLDQSLVEKFYTDGNALLQITVGLDSYHLEQETVIDQIKVELSDYTYHFRGEAIHNIENRQIAAQETLKILLLIVPIVIFILLIASKSWIEPIILLISLGFAIILNLGTNALLTDVSYITQTMALALQMALSLDYGLFLIHRYHEERENNSDVTTAIKTAVKRSFASITASALTTIAGFMSLFLMSYTIGLDIGLVLSKGILFSYLMTMILTPVLIFFMHGFIDKTKHKTFIRPMNSYIKGLFKFRYVLLSLFIILTIGSFILSNKTEYLYGNNTSFDEDSQVTIDDIAISKSFGSYQQIVLLVKNDDIESEIDLANELYQMSNIIETQTLITVVDPNIPREFLPPELLIQFVSENYTRFILKIDLIEENDALYVFQDQMYQLVSTYYDDFHIIGAPQATVDIKTVIYNDQLLITLASVVAIFVILAITFKSLLIPLLLVLVIQSAIWMNLSILYVQGIKTIYIGYLVVMAIQLGATIDYAVLMTHRYVENRKYLNSFEAMDKSYKYSFITLFISALILSVAGFTEGVFSDISSIKDIGYLLGKGALISFVYILVFLPILLMLLDKVIHSIKEHKNAQ